MPGSPDRVNPRNPNITAEQRAGGEGPLGPRQAADPRSQLVGVTSPNQLDASRRRRPRLLDEVPGPAGHRGDRRPVLADDPADRPGRGRSRSSSACRWGPTRAGDGAARPTASATALSLILYSMPYFVIGMPLIIIFAAGLGWFPTSGMLTPGATYEPLLRVPGDLVSHLRPAAGRISLGLIGGYSILMRSSVTETRAEDYITTARAKGLSDGKILRSHAIPNALLPAVTLIAINLGYVVGGRDHGRDRLQLAGPRDPHGRRAQLARLPGAAGDLPVPGGLGRHRQPRAPTSSTATSTRGCGDERRPDGRHGRSAERAGGSALRNARRFARRYCEAPRRCGRRGDPASSSPCSPSPRRSSSGPLQTVTTATGSSPGAAVAGAPPGDRRARAGHAQPHRPRRADLDGHRAPGDGHHHLPRGRDRDRVGLRRRHGPTSC